MAAVAAYARSEQGQLYGAACERYGVDPASAFSDDVLGFNFRIALALGGSSEKPADDDAAAAGRALEAEWLRAANG